MNTILRNSEFDLTDEEKELLRSKNQSKFTKGLSNGKLTIEDCVIGLYYDIGMHDYWMYRDVNMHSPDLEENVRKHVEKRAIASARLQVCSVLPDVSPTTVEAVLGAMVREKSTIVLKLRRCLILNFLKNAFCRKKYMEQERVCIMVRVLSLILCSIGMD